MSIKPEKDLCWTYSCNDVESEEMNPLSGLCSIDSVTDISGLGSTTVESSTKSSGLGVSTTTVDSRTKSSGLCASSTASSSECASFNPNINIMQSSSQDDREYHPVPWQQEDRNKAEEMASNRSKSAFNSQIAGWATNFTGSICDPGISSKLKEELKKGDSGLFTCLSFLQEVLADQKWANKQLGLILKEDGMQLKSLRDKVRGYIAKLSEALEVKRKYNEISERSKTADEQKESPQKLIQEKSEGQKSSIDRSTKVIAKPKLALKMNTFSLTKMCRRDEI